MSKFTDSKILLRTLGLECASGCTGCADGIKCLPIKVTMTCGNELVTEFKANYGSKLVPDVGFYYNHNNKEYIVNRIIEKDPQEGQSDYIKIFDIHLNKL